MEEEKPVPTSTAPVGGISFAEMAVYLTHLAQITGDLVTSTKQIADTVAILADKDDK